MGHVPLDGLLAALRLAVSSSCKMQIEATYDRLARHAEVADAKLTLSAICKLYDPSIDSRVRAKQLAVEDAVAEYRAMWASQVRNCVFFLLCLLSSSISTVEWCLVLLLY